MKLAGTVILFYPEMEIIQNIRSYLNILDNLYVIDNSEKNNLEIADQLMALPKVIYLHNGENMGIAKRLNQAADLAISAGYELLLTMDQDSSFEKDYAETYKNCIGRTNFDKVAMAGIEYLKKSEDTNCQSESVPELITSGSILSLNAWKLLGGFDEALFIDFVDHEFCYRSKLQGFQIKKFNNIFLNHAVGNYFEGRSVKSFKVTVRSTHSPLRIYYMIRNYLYIKEKYEHSFSSLLIQKRNDILTRIKNNFLYRRERINLCKYIYKAFIDYKAKRMGKINRSLK